ncbi:MAG: hypothetical protein RIC35_11185 [Marinoscillum sp.]
MRNLLLLLVSLFSLSLFAQDDLPVGHNQFIAEHYNSLDVAGKMLAYDHVAWVSSDSIQTLSREELSSYGGQWFCYLDSTGQYHALYGAYDSAYTLTAHYVVDSTTFAVNRTFQSFDTTLAVLFAKAYNLALARKREFLGPEDHLRYNHFIFLSDSTINVHFLPAFQPNGVMIYGAEQHYSLTLDATQIIDSTEYFNEYRGYKSDPDQQITIAYDDLDYTSIGAVFFLMYYEQHFKSIRILTKNYITTFIRGKNNKGSWIHAVRAEPKAKKKKKRKKKDNP